MVWTKITRPQYRREGMRYESDTTDGEWLVMEPLLPPPSALGRPRNRHASIGERDPLHCIHRLPMATIAEGFSTLLHGSGLFRRVVAQWNLLPR